MGCLSRTETRDFCEIKNSAHTRGVAQTQNHRIKKVFSFAAWQNTLRTYSRTECFIMTAGQKAVEGYFFHTNTVRRNSSYATTHPFPFLSLLNRFSTWSDHPAWVNTLSLAWGDIIYILAFFSPPPLFHKQATGCHDIFLAALTCHNNKNGRGAVAQRDIVTRPLLSRLFASHPKKSWALNSPATLKHLGSRIPPPSPPPPRSSLFWVFQPDWRCSKIFPSSSSSFPPSVRVALSLEKGRKKKKKTRHADLIDARLQTRITRGFP